MVIEIASRLHATEEEDECPAGTSLISDSPLSSTPTLFNLKGHQENGSEEEKKIPWFPKTLKELLDHEEAMGRYADDNFEELDHPAFTDQEYLKRRKVFTDAANTYKFGHDIPQMVYTAEENATWGTVFRNVLSLYPTHACTIHNRNLADLIEECGLNDKEVPQLDKLCNFLMDRTGFRLRPVAGFINLRDYLNGLAFRVTHVTQYLRHPSSPEYSPEPDICHDVLGHLPLYSDPEFAQYAQEVGLASLGVSDEWLNKIANLHRFTIEFGLVKERNGMRALGGALLSSSAELKHCLSEEAEREDKIFPLDTETLNFVSSRETPFQPNYFWVESIKDAREKLAELVVKMPRPFIARYEPYSGKMLTFNRKQEVAKLMRDLRRTSEAFRSLAFEK